MIFYEEILSKFQNQKVKYVIVGGVAFNLLGGSRNTFDLDIVVELTDSNLNKILRILKKEGYAIKIPVDPMGITNKSIRNKWIKNKNLKALNFYKTGGAGEIDLLIEPVMPYQKVKKDKRSIKIPPLNLPVISIDNLIKMKKIAGRPIDKLDISILRKIKRYESKK